MKSITPYLLKFAAAAIILTTIFRFCLSYTIEHGLVAMIIISAALYGGLMALAGWHFGKQDGEYLPIFDVGFRFHLTTFLIHVGISELWFAAGFQSRFEKVQVIHITALIWLVFLLIHFFFYLYARKKSINGLNRNDLFE
ncbi:hypothetical protein [Gynurincola endophyticus]|uniref:hypothetical protein n=1 Tax=Gynurincola endophyticus TaxID=2479004 RepID=UPI000F8F7BA3|nr:hypothetical protein [Gynurincola endophyticus]